MAARQEENDIPRQHVRDEDTDDTDADNENIDVEALEEGSKSTSTTVQKNKIPIFRGTRKEDVVLFVDQIKSYGLSNELEDPALIGLMDRVLDQFFESNKHDIEAYKAYGDEVFEKHVLSEASKYLLNGLKPKVRQLAETLTKGGSWDEFVEAAAKAEDTLREEGGGTAGAAVMTTTTSQNPTISAMKQEIKAQVDAALSQRGNFNGRNNWRQNQNRRQGQGGPQNRPNSGRRGYGRNNGGNNANGSNRNNNNNNNNSNKMNNPDIVCHRCGWKGHIARMCTATHPLKVNEVDFDPTRDYPLETIEGIKNRANEKVTTWVLQDVDWSSEVDDKDFQ